MNTRIETIDGDRYLNNYPYFNQLMQAAGIVAETHRDNGGTFNINGDQGVVRSVPVNGYAVGGFIPTVKVSTQRSLADQQEVVARFIGQIPRNLDGDKMYLLGTWIADGFLYIDAVKIITDIDEAMGTARKHGEIAVWDGIENEEINVAKYLEVEARAIEHAENCIEQAYSPCKEDVRF